MKYGIVLFPGSNCDRDSYHAVKNVMGEDAHMIWYEETHIDSYDCIILPGGFSYGDYLRAGAIAKFSPVMKQIIDFAKDGGLLIGICNGFQILLETGLLPGAMLQNRSVHFICKQVYIKCENNNTPFTNQIKKNEILQIPIAHMEGNYYCDDSSYRALEEKNQVIFRYCDQQGNVSDDSNPNGARGNIAGICNEQKNIFGMMPHPERAMEKILGSMDGKKIFQSIQSAVK